MRKHARRHAAKGATLRCDFFVFVFQLGDPRGLHHHTPSACRQGEAVYREHRGAGTGGQRAGQGNASVCLSLYFFLIPDTAVERQTIGLRVTPHSKLLKLRGESVNDARRIQTACLLYGYDAIKLGVSQKHVAQFDD